MTVAYIYGLYSTDNPEMFRYIGVSVNPKKRLYEHRSNTTNEVSLRNTHKINWIRKSKAAGFKIELKLLAEFPDTHTAFSYEEEFIGLYKSLGHDLTNNAPGGLGGNIVTDEVKKVEIQAKRNETFSSKEYRDKLSVTHKKRFENKEVYDRHINMVKTQHSDPVYREKFLAGLKKAQEETNYLEKAAEARRKPEWREGARKRGTEQFSSEESREKSREYAKKGWDTLTPDQKSARGFKASMTARYNRAKKKGWVFELTPIKHVCEGTI